MNLLQRYRSFEGTAEDLIAAAQTCAQLFGWGWPDDRLSERLVRYYASEGLVDRPERRGREAYYGYRQLVQLLLALRYADAKIPLPRIAQFNDGVPTANLEARLARPVPNPAEIDIELIRSRSSLNYRGPSPRVPFSGSSSSSSRSIALADLLDEIERIRRDWADDTGLLRKIEHELRELRAEVSKLQAHVNDLQGLTGSSLGDLTDRQRKIEAMLHDELELRRSR
jgi:DNA-binding transcriptional MerR regulator